jgi:uncharacterized protein DUF4160
VPTVLRIDGLRVVIYPNDHRPAHVHVIGPGWVVVVILAGPEVREAIGCNQSDARRALDLVAEHQETLLKAWSRIHG